MYIYEHSFLFPGLLLHQHVLIVLSAVYNTTDDGWIIYNDTQFFVNTDPLSMEAARAYCKKNFGELAVITGESERKFIWKQAGFFFKQARLTPRLRTVVRCQKHQIVLELTLIVSLSIMSQQISKGSESQYYIGMTLNLDKSFR